MKLYTLGKENVLLSSEYRKNTAWNLVDCFALSELAWSLSAKKWFGAFRRTLEVWNFVFFGDFFSQ